VEKSINTSDVPVRNKDGIHALKKLFINNNRKSMGLKIIRIGKRFFLLSMALNLDFFLQYPKLFN